VTRPSHPGRAGSRPFATTTLDATAVAAVRALPETCRIGSYTTTTNPNPPYDTTTTFNATAIDVPCAVEPGVDRQADVAGDPSSLAWFDLRVPHGTALTADQAVEITAGRNVGLVVRVVEVHDSSTEPLLRATVERITPGDA
jgi:hypothetical protein